jgi:hypothetical protein
LSGRQDATWSLEDRRWLLISMEKKKKTWWKSALEGGPEIDTQVRVHPLDPVIDACFSLTVSRGGLGCAESGLDLQY